MEKCCDRGCSGEGCIHIHMPHICIRTSIVHCMHAFAAPAVVAAGAYIRLSCLIFWTWLVESHHECNVGLQELFTSNCWSGRKTRRVGVNRQIDEKNMQLEIILNSPQIQLYIMYIGRKNDTHEHLCDQVKNICFSRSLLNHSNPKMSH